MIPGDFNFVRHLGILFGFEIEFPCLTKRCTQARTNTKTGITCMFSVPHQKRRVRMTSESRAPRRPFADAAFQAEDPLQRDVTKNLT